MKKRFTEEQILDSPKQAEAGVPVNGGTASGTPVSTPGAPNTAA